MVQEGDDLEVTISVYNHGMLPRFGLKLSDRLPPELERIGSEPVLSAIGGQERRTIVCRARARRRSACQLGPVDASCDDLLGIFHVRMSLGQTTDVLVYPGSLDIDALQLVPWLSGQAGVSRSMRIDGSEIRGVRQYHEGDELRRIHWPTSARASRLVVMEFEDSPKQQVLIAIDRSAGETQESLDCAARIARTLSDAVLDAGGALRLLTGTEIAIAETGRDAAAVYAALARMKPRADRDLLTDVESLAPAPGMPIVIIARPEADLEMRIAALADRGWPVFVALAAVSGGQETGFVNPDESADKAALHDLPELVRLKAGAAAGVMEVRCIECGACGGAETR